MSQKKNNDNNNIWNELSLHHGITLRLFLQIKREIHQIVITIVVSLLLIMGHKLL